MSRVVNQKVGLPGLVDVQNPAELQRAINALLQFARVANGEAGSAQRYVTADELRELKAKLDD